MDGLEFLLFLGNVVENGKCIGRAHYDGCKIYELNGTAVVDGPCGPYLFYDNGPSFNDIFKDNK